jgi:predicted aspartyl protease
MLVVAARVTVHPRAIELSGSVRASRPIVMMIDTGARFSVVTETIISSLGVAPIGSTDVRTSLQQVVERPVYRIVVALEFEDEYGAQHSAEIPLTVIASPPVPTNLPKDMTFLSPPASEGTTSTGITGDQGTTLDGDGTG